MHKKLLTAAGLLVVVAATNASPAWALWGCGATGGKDGWADSAGRKTKAEAIEAALKVCGPTCHIVGCSSNVETIDESLKIWRPRTAITSRLNCRGAKCKMEKEK